LFIDGVLVASSYSGYQNHISDSFRQTLINKGDRLFQLVVKDILKSQTVKAEWYSRSIRSEPIGGDDFFVPYVQ
jgi:dUTPase